MDDKYLRSFNMRQRCGVLSYKKKTISALESSVIRRSDF